LEGVSIEPEGKEKSANVITEIGGLGEIKE
jgi:hypothetical protein